MTVSNVLNGKPGASDETRRRVMEAVERLGYVPNMAAKGLKGGRTGLIGVVALDLTNQYALEIVRGIADELASVELEVLISATYQDGLRERDRVEFLTRGLVDGVLMIAPVLEDETLALLSQRGCPFVIVDPRRLDLDAPSVSVDNYHGMRSATEHILALGHDRVAYIGGDPDFDSSKARAQGFRDAMQLGGRVIDESLVTSCDFSYKAGFRTAVRLIGEHRPTAIVAAADLIAFGAVDAARSHGLNVPEQVSVVGFDDLPQAAQSFPGLTTVRQPLHDMGQTAVRALLSLIAGTPPPVRRMQLPTNLVVRGTTATPMLGEDQVHLSDGYGLLSLDAPGEDG
jgi:LacI family transcriptional regulator